MAKTGGRNVQKAALFILQQTYIFLYGLVGFVSENETAFLSFWVALSMFSTSRNFPNLRADPNNFFQVSHSPSSPR
jgi:hypothetical protein